MSGSEVVKSQVQHTISNEKEVYYFNLKDKTGRNGVEIANPEGKELKLKAIRILKVPGKNNKIVVELIKEI